MHAKMYSAADDFFYGEAELTIDAKPEHHGVPQGGDLFEAKPLAGSWNTRTTLEKEESDPPMIGIYFILDDGKRIRAAFGVSPEERKLFPVVTGRLKTPAVA